MACDQLEECQPPAQRESRTGSARKMEHHVMLNEDSFDPLKSPVRATQFEKGRKIPVNSKS